MIRYLDAFADFDPLTEHLSEEEFWEVGYIYQQARSLLPTDFTIQDLNAGLEILHQLKRHHTNAVMDYRKALPSSLQTHGVAITPPLQHFLCSDYVEKGERPNGAPFEWSALFATSALASISDLLSIARNPVHQFKPADEQDLMAHIENARQDQYERYRKQLPSEALESLGFARLFAEREQLAKHHKKRGKAISKTRIESYHPIKLAITTLFNELPKDLSVRKAAKIIYDALNDKEKALLLNEDPQKQIEIWLGQFKKGTLPGQEKLPPYTQ